MDDAEAFLVAGDVGAAAGVDEVAGVDGGLGLGGVCEGDGDAVGELGEGDERAVVLDLGAGGGGVFEEEMVEGGAFDLEGDGMAGETTLAELEFERVMAVGGVELCAEFAGQAHGFEDGEDAEFFEERLVVGEEGFADVEAREGFAFDEEDLVAASSEEGCGGGAAGAAADDEHIHQWARVVGGHGRRGGMG